MEPKTMRSSIRASVLFGLVAALCVVYAASSRAQSGGMADNAALKTPLSHETLMLLANEVSGQMAFNNLVKLAGAPWIRDPSEFTGTFYEAQTIYDLVRSYGIETTRIERHSSSRTFDYPFEAELWMLEPERRLIARLEADPALWPADRAL
jgi:hypothetical protein